MTDFIVNGGRTQQKFGNKTGHNFININSKRNQEL